MMELKELTEFTQELFRAENKDELRKNIMKACIENDIEKLSQFKEKVGDLKVDYMQKIFQYYYADRKEKMQDYTPKSLALLVSKLIGENDRVIDMCAGSGALTIQDWVNNPDTEYTCYELDENVLPFLIFNLMLRNIKAKVVQKDLLTNEIISKYEIERGEEFGTCKCY